jgi:hypothetical protein
VGLLTGVSMSKKSISDGAGAGAFAATTGCGVAVFAGAAAGDAVGRWRLTTGLRLSAGSSSTSSTSRRAGTARAI